MDQIDDAAEVTRLFTMAALSKRRPVPEHDGHCINCGKESDGAYCDRDCGEDAERFDRARQRAGL